MLNALRHFDNLGTPEYFFILLNTLNENPKAKWKLNDITQLFNNKIIDGRNIHDGCIELAIRIKILYFKKDIIIIDENISSFLNTKTQMSDKFIEYLFRAFKDDESFHNIFCSKYISFDIVYKSIQINNSAFGFRFSNFKQLLIDFGAIKIHPTPELSSFIINLRYKKLFDKTILPEIRKRKIGINEFHKSMAQQQIYGEEAEKFVLEFEHKRLNQKKEIDWVAEYIVNEGYDIASYDSEDDDKYNRFIEVKSFDGETPYFFWSRNEISIAKIRKDKYWLYLVNRSEIKKEGYIPIMEQNPHSILENKKWTKQIEKYKIELNKPLAVR